MNFNKFFINICRLLMIILIVVFISVWNLYGVATTVGCLALSFVPEVFERFTRIVIPDWIRVMYTIFLLIAMIWGNAFGGYSNVPYFDKFLHVYSGVMACLLGYISVNTLNKNYKITDKLVSVFSFCFAEAIAVAWEIFEFTGDRIFPGSDMQRVKESGIFDTMSDLIVSLIGAALVSILLYISKRRKRV